VIDSFNNTVADSYKYVMPFNIDEQYQLNWFKPAIYAKVYFDRIFTDAGYSYDWADLLDARFDKLLIPYNGDQNIIDWSDYKVVAEGFSLLKLMQAFKQALILLLIQDGLRYQILLIYLIHLQESTLLLNGQVQMQDNLINIRQL
jgi:hypothetical protein